MNRLIFGQLVLFWSCIVMASEVRTAAVTENCGQLIENSHQKIFSTFALSLVEKLDVDDLADLNQSSRDILKVICQNRALKNAVRFLSPA